MMFVTGLVAKVEFPLGRVLDTVEAEQEVKHIHDLIVKYPQFKAQLSRAEAKWKAVAEHLRASVAGNPSSTKESATRETQFSLTTKTGNTYEHARVTSTDRDGFTVMYDGGVARISFDELPLDLSQLPAPVRAAAQKARDELEQKKHAEAERIAREVARADVKATLTEPSKDALKEQAVSATAGPTTAPDREEESKQQIRDKAESDLQLHTKDADPDDVVLAKPLHWETDHVEAPAGTHIKVIRRSSAFVTFKCDEFQIRMSERDFNAHVEQTEKSRKAGENGTQQFKAQVEESWQKACQLYPGLRDPNSNLYKLVQARIQQHRERVPEVYDSPGWPLMEAKQAAEILQFQQRTSVAPAARKPENGAPTKPQTSEVEDKQLKQQLIQQCIAAEDASDVSSNLSRYVGKTFDVFGLISQTPSGSLTLSGGKSDLVGQPSGGGSLACFVSDPDVARKLTYSIGVYEGFNLVSCAVLTVTVTERQTFPKYVTVVQSGHIINPQLKGELANALLQRMREVR